ncbi:YdcH family protein [Tropicimonas sp. S265A]|uniref:YdcH family protein n=1 Tax=Tropicimonas sp. S265A TaxID=3415134 RepID=UPI003C7E0BA3
MSNTPHELAEEFPDKVAVMSTLKAEDAHFARLFDEYHEVNRAVHRAETRVEAISDAAEEELRRTRMRLKDEIWTMICAAEAA